METCETKAGEGTRLGSYRLVAELGRGGMAEVHLAATQGPGGFNKLVVVKVITAQYAEDPEFVAMFLDEARLAARVRHANVVQTNEVGEEGGRYFMVMEYLDGQPLNRLRMRLGRAHALPLTLHLRVLAEALSGLHHAHELTDYEGRPLGVVHRDVSPENVFVTYDGTVKVVDFGIAKARDSVIETQVGTVKGKVAFMAPEQALGRPVDRRADVFAVGVMLWEAATGVRMWRGVPHTTILDRLARGEIPAPRSVSPELPDRLDAIIRKATAPNREARYATAAELQAELEELIVELEREPGDPARRLGSLVAAHFEDERAQIRAVVEAHLRGLPQTEPTRRHAGQPALDRPTPPPSDRCSGTSSPAVLAAVTMAVSTQSHTRRGALAAVVLGAALVLGGVGSLAGKRGIARAASAPSEVVSAAEPVVVTAKLHVSATPGAARIWLDDRLLQGNPGVAELPVGDVVHTLEIEAPGYATRLERLTVTRDRVMDVVLNQGAGAGAGQKNEPVPAPAPSRVRSAGGHRRLDTANPYQR